MSLTSMAAAETLNWEGGRGENEPLTVKIRKVGIEHRTCGLFEPVLVEDEYQFSLPIVIFNIIILSSIFD